MDLDELQSVRDRERQTDKLQQLRASFYADAGEFIQQLREQRSAAADRADDPFDAPEVNRLSDEIDTAEQTVEAIYEKRVGKIVKAASFAAADLPANSDGMTAEEQDLFETLVADIKTNREHVLDVLAGTDSPVDTADDDTPTPPEPTTDDGLSGADAMGTGTESAEASGAVGQGSSGERSDEPPGRDRSSDPSPDEPEPPTDRQTEAGADPPQETPPAGNRAERGDDTTDGAEGPVDGPAPRGDGGTTQTVDRETVRITDDVGPILGVDEREYDLSTDDVVVLPEENAAPLVERDAAERLD